MTGIENHKNIFIAGWLLAITALIGTGMMVMVNWHSKPFIKNNERKTLLRSLDSVIPSENYNNDILKDTIAIVDKKYLGSEQPVTIYRARKDNKPISAALQVVAPNGYSGEIVILVGVNYTGEITGVRIVKHRETPGLGDSIEIQRSKWVESFNGKSLYNPSQSEWKVKRDGGYFDQFTGATITPRAVVGAVHKALLFFEINREQIFTEKK